MGLSAAQIRTKLKPMMDFAPAILAAGEIVEAAEAAEQQLADHAVAVSKARAELDALAKQKADRLAEIAAVQEDLDRVKRETAEEKTVVTKKLKEVTEKLGLAQKALQSTQDDHANVLATHAQELEAKRNELDLHKRQLEQLRNSIQV
jgi:septal ring factor EnvC (AmiA/AmiB activator)